MIAAVRTRNRDGVVRRRRLINAPRRVCLDRSDCLLCDAQVFTATPGLFDGPSYVKGSGLRTDTAMADKKVNEFYTRPPVLGKWEGFQQFLWNPETKQFCGRTGASWGKFDFFLSVCMYPRKPTKIIPNVERLVLLCILNTSLGLLQTFPIETFPPGDLLAFPSFHLAAIIYLIILR